MCPIFRCPFCCLSVFDLRIFIKPFGIFKLFLKPNFLSLTYEKFFISDIFMNLALMKTNFVSFYCILFTDEADSPSKEENNFFRLYLLCQKIATTAVRLFFDSKVPGHTLETFLKQHKSNLTSQFSVCRCTKDQKAKLFPGELFFIAMSIKIGRNRLITLSERQYIHRSNLR